MLRAKRLSDDLVSWLLVAGCFFAPFLALRPRINVTLSDLLLVLGGFLLIVRRRSFSFFPADPLTTVLWYGAGAMLILGLGCSTVLRGEPRRGLIVLAQYMWVLFVLPPVFATMPRRILKKAGASFLVGLTLVSALGLLAYFSESGHLRSIFVSRDERLRSLIGDPNDLAKVIAMSLPLFHAFWGVRESSRVWIAVGVAVNLAAIILTSSVSGLLVVLVVGLMLCAGRGLVLGLLFPGAVVGLSLAWRTAARRIWLPLLSGQLDAVGTWGTRWGLMRESWSLVSESPVFGIGADMYPAVTSFGAAYVHNTFLLIWAEGGVIAFAGWVLLVTSLATAAVGNIGRSLLPIAIPLSTVAGFTVIALSSTHMYGRFWYVPVLLALSMVRAYCPPCRESRQ